MWINDRTEGFFRALPDRANTVLPRSEQNGKIVGGLMSLVFQLAVKTSIILKLMELQRLVVIIR